VLWGVLFKLGFSVDLLGHLIVNLSFPKGGWVVELFVQNSMNLLRTVLIVLIHLCFKGFIDLCPVAPQS